MKPLRIVFFGTPDFAVASLKALVEAKKNVVAIVTAADKPAGRGQKLQPSAVKLYAEEIGLPVLQPTNLKSEEFLAELKRFDPDIQVVVAFRMLPESVWNLPRLGTYNVHGSLLPDYRGAAPINWAIVNGEKETGVTTFKLQHEIDTGSILLQKSLAIGPNDNAGMVYNKLMHLGAEALIASFDLIENDRVELIPQPESSHKHAPKIQKEDCQIDWDKPVDQVHNFIRGMNPFPGAYTLVTVDNGIEKWKILNSLPSHYSRLALGQMQAEAGRLFIGTGSNPIEILELQLPGRKKMEASEFINGYGTKLKDIKIQ